MKPSRFFQVVTLTLGALPAACWTMFFLLIAFREFQDLPRENLFRGAFPGTLAVVLVAAVGCIGLSAAAFSRTSSLVVVFLAVGVCTALPGALVLAFIWPMAVVTLIFPAAIAIFHLVHASDASQAQPGVQADGP